MKMGMRTMTTGMSNRQTLLTTPYQVIDLGRMAYAEAWALQRDYAAQRGADVIPNTLLFVEHPHTYTLGTKGPLRRRSTAGW